MRLSSSPSLGLALLGLVSSVAAAPASNSSSSVSIHWLDGKPKYNSGTTFGLPWPQGKHQPNGTHFSVSDGSNDAELLSWVTGYWPDGSIKWTGHAIPATSEVQDAYTVKALPGSGKARSGSIKITKSDDEINVDTGKIAVSFGQSGSNLVKSIVTSSGQTVGENGRLVLHSRSDDVDDAESGTSSKNYNFQSNIISTTVGEKSGDRTVVTIRGNHTSVGKSTHDPWLPFVVRFYLYANSDSIKLVHSLTFDGNSTEDFITSLGVRFDVPLAGEELYDRHVRLAGPSGGFLTEAVQGITGLRRDPGQAIRAAQHKGEKLPDTDTWDVRVSSRLQWIPAWADYSLAQLSPDGFTLRKRTKSGQSWVNIPGGNRSTGLAYVGGASQGGLAIGLRDFWKRYPTGLDISNANTDAASLTLWLYSPQAQPLDLRPFHDGLGQDGYKDQLDALDITYEDWEPEFDTPYGISRSSEITIRGFSETPTTDELADLVEHINEPPLLVAEPEYIKESKALGVYWDLPDAAANSKAAAIEEHLDFFVEYYKKEVEQRRWYGFLDYGDFMHTYDPDRHQWRYDVGGYAWDNSELSPDLFFWLYFLRTGRADAYRFAEALTRHTSEVDVYHIGKWKGLGTRHGVQHWGDSAKQARISQPLYRKFFYYISGGDERVGELVAELLDTDKTYGVLDPQRKVRTDGWVPTPNSKVAFSLGTDFSALAAGWLLEWERRGPRWQEAKKKLTSTVTGIAELKNGFVTGNGLYSLQNFTLYPPPTDPDNKGVVAVSHLSAAFGLPEVVSDIIDYYGDDLPDGFKDAWLDYCYYFNAPAAEQKARYGVDFGKLNLYQGHSRLTAYAGFKEDNATISARAWTEFYNTDGYNESSPWNVTHVGGTDLLVPLDEAAWSSTNEVAQYGIAAISNLALAAGALGA